MAISFINNAHTFISTSGTGLTLAEPASLASGDVCYALMIDGSTGPTRAEVPPSGYTSLKSVVSGTNMRVSLFRGVRTGSAFGSTWTFWSTSAAVYREVGIVAFRGVNTTTPENAATYDATAPQAAACNPPAVTPTAAGAWILCGGAAWSGPTSTFGAPTNYTIRYGASTSEDGMFASRSSGFTIGVSEDPGAFTGNTGTDTTWGFSISLNPASVFIAPANPSILNKRAVRRACDW